MAALIHQHILSLRLEKDETRLSGVCSSFSSGGSQTDFFKIEDRNSLPNDFSGDSQDIWASNYALERSIAIVRAAVQWLSYRLGIISNALEVNCRLQWWYTSKAHFARVLLERILLPIERDVIDSINKDSGVDYF
ncbi:hypothetical protein MTR_4g009900 [Medicago truncatula]|uniref:Uncharacterized protein n=1 Tax=Medicago truncatula TaxID=3880 RepID=G7JGV5_MEDTR|nr:hypothetical protein MTR_4g009900 [Medicago truncatula]